ncbi:asparagine synthetase domain-containing protein [[Candida] railenensis]|uniref:Asparagine synthetase domain-containing protein n=1 Tax=[Candida] railenensis TaxID=45579 RepID=A0A9P0VVM5_9ASCO|nr:asparagine synthetase domain-containing protein [[Candida] railenensis]
MCGILCCISREPPSIPKYFEQNIRNFDDNIVVWDSQDEAFIQKLIDIDLKQTETLSSEDQHKINNLDKLRICNARLNQIKNTIGKSESHNSELAEAKSKIELEMKSLALVDHIDKNEMANLPPREIGVGLFTSLVPVIASRGPNYLKYISFHIEEAKTWVEQFSSVLSLRQPFVQQPVQVENEQISIQFNGELYNQECLDSNDSKFIGDKIISNIGNFGQGNREKAIVETIAELEGEFAYAIVDKAKQRCYFGRDYVGKRSLVYSLKESSGLVISSVTNGKNENNWEECKAEVVYMYDFESCKLDSYEMALKGARHPKPICNSALNKLKGIEVSNRISKFKEVFFEACKVRVDTIHPIHEDNPHITNLGILFSGGLDCTVIAGTVGQLFSEMSSLSDKTVLIDLLTVGFDNPRTEVSASGSPDRKLAKKSWLELANKFNKDSRISFRLVEVDVNYEEWLRHKSRVERLMYPCDTEMDLSIAIAFYFASRASNGVKLTLNLSTCEIETQANYTSKAKVLLSGLGADELFAGYSRHERVFNDLKPDSGSDVLEKAYSDLANELTNDIKVIYKRNLGRDDRVIASWGKELRYPFLEEKVINYVVQQVELDLKFNHSWETTTNKKGKVSTRLKPVRKWILREYAETLGLTGVKNELKRAIQFGAKSAKMEIGQGKTKGTDQL